MVCHIVCHCVFSRLISFEISNPFSRLWFPSFCFAEVVFSVLCAAWLLLVPASQASSNVAHQCTWSWIKHNQTSSNIIIKCLKCPKCWTFVFVCVCPLFGIAQLHQSKVSKGILATASETSRISLCALHMGRSALPHGSVSNPLRF